VIWTYEMIMNGSACPHVAVCLQRSAGEHVYKRLYGWSDDLTGCCECVSRE